MTTSDATAGLDLYSIPAAARAVKGMTVKRLRALIASGDLRVIMLPGRKHPVITLEDLRDAVEARKTKVESQGGRKCRAGGRTSSGKGRARLTGTTAGPSTVIEFEEAVTRIRKTWPSK